MYARTVNVRSGDASLSGDLTLPDTAHSVVLFAHGSGSSRLSPRNRAVAERLNDVGLGTLLLDLLTPEEAEEDSRTGGPRFDIGLLGRRLTGAVDWLAVRSSDLPFGLFGASTGAAAALTAAVERPQYVHSVVCRGGRPDLAGDDVLARVRTPVLLLVGGRDDVVLGLNRDAADRMRAPCELKVVPGASHLFEEPGALEDVADSAASWFSRMAPAGERPGG